LGWAHANGEGVEKDYKEASRLYEKDASEGGYQSAHALALLYLDGNGVIKDVEEALKWLKKSSEGGYMEAKKSLGSMYDDGNVVDVDRVTASKYYLEVALSGDVDYQRLMGVRFQEGLGVSGDANPDLSGDLNEAYAWFNIAASNGDTQAAGLREDVAKSLDSERILAAQKRSREILKEIEAKKAKK
jgi:TPR repeat protein